MKRKKRLGAHTTVPVLQLRPQPEPPSALQLTGSSIGQAAGRVCREAKARPGGYKTIVSRLRS